MAFSRQPGEGPAPRRSRHRLVVGDAGPEVRGPGEAILMALNGRGAALADLTGDGVPVLAGRIKA